MAIGPIPLAFYILIHEDFILYHSDKISFAPQMAILSYTQFWVIHFLHWFEMLSSPKSKFPKYIWFTSGLSTLFH